MPKERERIVVKMSDGSQYEGDISLHGRDRVVDTMNHEEPFFNLRNVKTPDGGEIPLIVLCKAQVVSLAYLAPPTQEIKVTRVLRKGDQPRAVFERKRQN